jgi:uncharacterized membrane protein
MKMICKALKCFQVFCGAVAFLVAFDMLVLGGKIKLWVIAVANTTSYSPFSTDGQSNWLFIFTIIGIGLLSYLAYRLLDSKKENKKDK